MSTRKVVHPLFIPKGSVRALVTLVITTACCYQLIVQQAVGGAPSTALFLVLAYYFYYFAHRSGPGASADGALNPLFLPRGLVRGVIAAFVGTGGYLITQGELLGQPQAIRMVMITVAAFFAGVCLNVFYEYRRRNPEVKTPLLDLLDHLKAVVVILAALMLGWAWVVNLDAAMNPTRDVAALAAIAFYFGSR